MSLCYRHMKNNHKRILNGSLHNLPKLRVKVTMAAVQCRICFILFTIMILKDNNQVRNVIMNTYVQQITVTFNYINFLNYFNFQLLPHFLFQLLMLYPVWLVQFSHLCYQNSHNDIWQYEFRLRFLFSAINRRITKLP